MKTIITNNYNLREEEMTETIKRVKVLLVNSEEEKAGNFELRYIKLNEIGNELNSNVQNYGDPHGIAKEMLELLSIYKTKNVKTKFKKLQ